MTRPSTIDGGDATPGARAVPCARGGATAASARQPSVRASLRIELPEVFGPEILEIGLELIGGQLRWIRAGGDPLVGALFDARRLSALVVLLVRRLDQELVGGVDRGGEPQRDGDAVRRAGIDVDHGLTALDL